MYCHRGATAPMLCPREDATTMGTMTTGPFREGAHLQPPSPPPKYKERDLANFHSSNPFSRHTNKYEITNYGEIFGDGDPETRELGKKLSRPNRRLHITDPTFLNNHEIGTKVGSGRMFTDYEYNFSRPQPRNQLRRRRFPKIYPDPPSGKREKYAELLSTTTDWSPEITDEIPTSVLGLSQIPYPQDTGRWKYAFHGLPECYPRCGPRLGKNKIYPYNMWSVSNLKTELPPLSTTDKSATVGYRDF
ncbi:hypothetical protein NP493_1162g00015 [Ridgeia piscesae]|uniref:Domain of unknown function with conserved HDNR motif domain-containing protein n=1 Tax=Ridgeia piscesae TaxID=27915 RepID=A0AAD9KEM8_RIDPI|nr:hypothetical protein NP493_1162g00015 [Ridgeia piscesae]